MINWDDKQFHWHLNTRRFGRQFKYFDEIESTNRWLIENESAFTLNGGVVIAGHQTAGRGRHSRTWVDVPGSSLLCSVMLMMRGRHKAIGLLSLIAAVALARTLRKHDSVAEVSLKWPNDVLLEHKKVAGVLAETTSLRGGEVVVIGIGVNVRSVPEFEYIWPAASVHEYCAWHPGREVLLAEILNHLEPLCDKFFDDDLRYLRAAWEEFGPKVGSRIRRIEPPNTIEGEYVGLGEFGQLLLRNSHGEIQEVYSGDIVAL